MRQVASARMISGRIVGPASTADLVLARPGQIMRYRPTMSDAPSKAADPTKRWMRLARFHQQSGRFDQGLACLQRVLEMDPDHPAALAGVARAMRADLPAELEERMKTIADDPVAALDGRWHVLFALGLVYEDRRKYGDAFKAFAAANQLRLYELQRLNLGYDPDGHAQFVDQVVTAFDADHFAKATAAGPDSDVPIFIVGMPRSGTTLVEHILAAHPDVHAAGELEHIPELVRRLGDPGRISELSAGFVRDLALEYMSMLRKLDPAARRITDKLPENYLHLGLIRAMFPRARVIHCRRDAMDTCWSCFQTDFFANLPWARHPRLLGHYYRQYVRVMTHWRAVLPGPMLETCYEELVTEPEPVIRRLVEFCGLPWDEACLSPEKVARLVQTASNRQVRQPIHRNAIGRSRHYSLYLRPLSRELGLLDSADAASLPR